MTDSSGGVGRAEKGRGGEGRGEKSLRIENALKTYAVPFKCDCWRRVIGTDYVSVGQTKQLKTGKVIFAFSFRKISSHCGGEDMAKVVTHGGSRVWQSFLTCLWPMKQRTPLKPVGITLKRPPPGLLLPGRVPKIAQILEFQNMCFRIVLKARNKEFKI